MFTIVMRGNGIDYMGLFYRRLLKIQLSLKRMLHSASYMKTYNRCLRAYGVDIQGNVKFIHPSVYIDLGYANMISIGDNCVISVNTIILAHDFALECGMASIGMENLENEKKTVNNVHLGENVFVGAGCIILPGTHIGDNCIIGAGTVCTGEIPDNSIVVGEKWKVIGKTTEWIQKKLDEERDK